MKKLELNLKPIPSVSSRTKLMMQNLFNLPETALCPSVHNALETQNDANPSRYVENFKNSLILHIPEVTDGILSNLEYSDRKIDATHSADNPILNYDPNFDNFEVDLDNCGLEYVLPVMNIIQDIKETESKNTLEINSQKIKENVELVSCESILEQEASKCGKENNIVENHDILTRMRRQTDPDYIQEDEDADASEQNTDPDNTEESTIVNNKRKRRKRHDVKQETWKENINKKKREEGKEYTSKRKTDEGWNYNINRERRLLQPRCDCKISSKSTSIQCFKITDQDRKDIFDNFWNTLDWNQRKIYINMQVKIIPTKRQRNRKLENESRRSITWQYFLQKSDIETRVCKKMFLNTLCIGERSVRTWKQTLSGHANEGGDNENGAVNSNILVRNAEQNRIVKEFFENIPKVESHYCRASSSKLYLEPQWLSKSALYKFYKTNWCNENQSNPVSIATFHHIFDSMNLSLFKPKKDQCDTCVAHEAGNLGIEIYETHQQKKKEAREAKETDKTSDNKVFCMDLQSVLLSPKSNVSSSYFKTKLIVHNFTIFDMKTKDGYCFIWHESAGGVGSNDYSSIICYFLENSVIPSINTEQKIILYSDGCTAQNRNALLANSLLNVTRAHNTIIEQKYLEKGHTQMEADSMHATIERKLHNRVIYVPADYVGICLHAREKPRPYVVKYLDYTFFKNFEGIKCITSLRPGRKLGDPVVTDLRAIKYSPNGEIFYKLRHPDEYKTLEFRKVSKQVPVIAFTRLPPLYTKPIPLKKEKWNHLQQLKSSVPKDYHSFYDNLPFQQ